VNSTLCLPNCRFSCSNPNPLEHDPFIASTWTSLTQLKALLGLSSNNLTGKYVRLASTSQASEHARALLLCIAVLCSHFREPTHSLHGSDMRVHVQRIVCIAAVGGCAWPAGTIPRSVLLSFLYVYVDRNSFEGGLCMGDTSVSTVFHVCLSSTLLSFTPSPLCPRRRLDGHPCRPFTRDCHDCGRRQSQSLYGLVSGQQPKRPALLFKRHHSHRKHRNLGWDPRVGIFCVQVSDIMAQV
jgi:hypothetical protein